MRGKDRRYRYRTAAFHGPWRASREQAEQDAVEAGLATWGVKGRRRLNWRVVGAIETGTGLTDLH